MAAPETLNVKQMVEAYGAINALIQNDRQKSFTFVKGVRSRLARNLAKARAVYEKYVENKNALVKELGTVVLDKDGKETDNVEVKKDSPNFDQFTKEHDLILAENTYQVLTPLTEDELGDNQIDVELIGVLQDAGLLKE